MPASVTARARAGDPSHDSGEYLAGGIEPGASECASDSGWNAHTCEPLASCAELYRSTHLRSTSSYTCIDCALYATSGWPAGRRRRCSLSKWASTAMISSDIVGVEANSRRVFCFTPNMSVPISRKKAIVVVVLVRGNCCRRSHRCTETDRNRGVRKRAEGWKKARPVG